MKTTIHLARHGETLWNSQQRFQGELDSELTIIGKQQSLQLAQTLANQAIDCIISSALGRAIATAKICQQQLNIPHIIEKQLSERNLGQWQGQQLQTLTNEATYAEVLQAFTDLAPPNGESAQACGQRIFSTIKAIAEHAPNKNLLIIFHGEALRCFLLHLGQTFSDNAYQLFTNGFSCKLHYQHVNDKFQLCCDT
ncbi:MAG: histidine phosphatase family protein [Thalassotalea sp.]